MPRIVGGSLTGGFEGQPAARRGAKAASETKTVLYLHQGLVSAYDPSPVPLVSAPVLETIRMSPPDWQWLIRLHPRWQGLAEYRREAPRSRHLPAELSGRISFRAAEPNAAQPTCFDAADAVLTGFSASACLAHDYGLPVVIHHPVGRDLFAPAISGGPDGICAGAGRHCGGAGARRALTAARTFSCRTILTCRARPLWSFGGWRALRQPRSMS